MCELLVEIPGGERRWNLPHEALSATKKLLTDLKFGGWPRDAAICLDLWPGEPPVLVRGSELYLITVEQCAEIEWGKVK